MYGYNEALIQQLEQARFSGEMAEAYPDRPWYKVINMVARVGDTYFISNPIKELLLEAASSLPESTAVTKDSFDRLARAFIWFEEPWEMVSDTGETTVLVGGFATCLSSDATPDHFSHSTWPLIIHRNAVVPGPEVIYADGDQAGEARIVIGTIPTELERGLKQETGWGVAVDIGKFIYSMTKFISQDILETTPRYPQRATQRRLKRENKLPEEPLIKVVQLRRVIREYQEREGASDREYNVQWIVRGHWRNQWYPSKGIHQPKWISPYVKGPEDKPLKPSRGTLHAVVR